MDFARERYTVATTRSAHRRIRDASTRRALGVLGGCCLWLAASGVATAADAGQALQAEQRGDYGTAAQVWMTLAQANNPVAEYNLGLMYRKGQGVAPNPVQARQWFLRAATHGLTDAYTMLGVDTPGVKPDSQTRAALDPQLWIVRQNPNYYTLQLASSKSIRLIEKYIDDNALAGKAGYYKSRRGGEDWYALVYGSYGSAAEAQAAIADLPQDLRKWSPWVRKFADIQRIMER